VKNNQREKGVGILLRELTTPSWGWDDAKKKKGKDVKGERGKKN